MLMFFFVLEIIKVMFTKFKESVKHEFDMTDLGKRRYSLRVGVVQRSNGIFIY